MSAQALLLTALNQRFERYLAERKRCLDVFSADAVHDLRVAARRLLAIIELLHAVVPGTKLLKVRRAIKDQLDSLDELRDTQVMLAEFSVRLDTLREVIPLQKYLKKREKRLLKTAEQDVCEFKVGAITHRMDDIRASLSQASPGQDITALLLAGMDDAYRRVTRRIKKVDPTRTASVHRVRIAFKKFRYTLEIIHPLIPIFREALFKDMHDYQAVMGDIQDVEVLLRTLRVFSAAHKGYDPLPALSYYEQRYAELIIACTKNMNRFFSFWREMPDQPFPWESKETGIL